MPEPADPANREGAGRYAVIRKPAGVLWHTRSGDLGFQPVPGEEASDILADIAHYKNADKRTFDRLAEKWGADVIREMDDLNHWGNR